MNKIEQLKNALPKLSDKDRAFASSMLSNASKYGGFTPKQEHWVDVLIMRAEVPEDHPVGDVGNFSGVYDLFKAAKQHQRFPKLNLQLADHLPVVLSLAGERSKAPGVVNVTDGGPYGSNKWYGRVYPDGRWEPGRDYDELGDVAKLLKDLASDPLGVAGKYGKLTGYCCFCHRALKDEQSVAAGYGPVCAEHWGLKGAYKAAKPIFSKLVKEGA
jgi:hypothetical protein